MNKLRIISDIHLEFGKYDLPVYGDEKEQILIIAGDLAPIKKKLADKFLINVCDRFKYVIMVAGNHEYYYKGSIVNDEVEVDKDNFYFLQNTLLMIEDLLIMGCTMWTNFNDREPIQMDVATGIMTDFETIKYDKKYFTVTNWLAENEKSRNFLWDTLELFKHDDRKKVVITHHLPSVKSITESFYETRGIGYVYNYASDDMEEFLNLSNLWIHGHTHDSVDYEENGCRIVSNPRGYHKYEENNNFNPELIIDI